MGSEEMPLFFEIKVSIFFSCKIQKNVNKIIHLSENNIKYTFKNFAKQSIKPLFL